MIRILLFLCLSWGLSSCGAVTATKLCADYETVACVCLDGAPGFQQCNGDGSAFTGPCQCSPLQDGSLSDIETPTDTASKTDTAQDTAQDTKEEMDDSTPSDAGPCVGCIGEPCTDDQSCVSGLCLLNMGVKVCSEVCVDECPAGWTCNSVETESAGSLLACIPNATHLCLPCVSNDDCSNNTAQNLCLDYGNAGSFCGASCTEDLDCPTGYLCEETPTSQGGSSTQCVAETGSCECSPYAIEMSLETACSIENEQGTCDGVRVCRTDGLTACDARTPVVETCNNLDDNCDGSTDEGLGTTTCGLGACVQTIENCSEGLEQNCDPFAGASVETCDGIDNDCDGFSDEDLGSESCGLGVCAQTIENCASGVAQFCNPFTGASAEICDGLDNDCDGTTDEELGTINCGQGICEQTIQSCINGVPQSCNAFTGASAEICDGIDNDCDGSTDEDLGTTSCGQGACQKTVQACVGGVPQSCDPNSGASAETCDGVDNDCDGSIDEGLAVDGGWTDWSCGPCGSGCPHSTKFCTRSCTNPAPSCGGAACSGASTESQFCSNTYNIVAADEATCNSSVQSIFPGHPTGCTIGGGCCGNGQSPSTGCTSANAQHWGACICASN